MGMDFSTFVISLASAAMMGLGLAPRPDTGKQEKDLELSRQNIDLLKLIKEKTKNNLTEDEERLLDRLLLECHTKYLEESKE